MLRNVVIAIDLDGTLLGSQNVIIGGERTIELLRQLSTSGVRIAINTGRLDHDMIAIQRRYGLTIDSRISQNGCVVVDDYTLRAHLANKGDMQLILQYLQNFPNNRVELNTISNRYWLTPRGKNAPKEYYDSSILVPSFEDVIQFQPMTEFLCFGTFEDLQEIKSGINQKFDQTVAVMTSRSSLEILPEGISKGRALREKYPDDYIIGIGDSENDRSVFEVSDYSYGVGGGELMGATENLTDIADALVSIGKELQ